MNLSRGARCYGEIKGETQLGTAGDKWKDSEEAAALMPCSGCSSAHGDKGGRHYTTAVRFSFPLLLFFVWSPHTHALRLWMTAVPFLASFYQEVLLLKITHKERWGNTEGPEDFVSTAAFNGIWTSSHKDGHSSSTRRSWTHPETIMAPFFSLSFIAFSKRRHGTAVIITQRSVSIIPKHRQADCFLCTVPAVLHSAGRSATNISASRPGAAHPTTGREVQLQSRLCLKWQIVK